MSNYRGGERSYSNYGMEHMKAIRDGTTERQIERNQMQKIIHGVAVAGLTGISGALKGRASANADNKNRSGIMSRAIANAKQVRDSQYANAPSPDYKPMADEVGDAHPAINPDGTAYGQSTSYQDMAKSAMDDAVAKGREANKVNSAASMAPVGGEYTPQGRDALNEEAQVGAADLNTSRSLIGQGGGTGLGGSMKTWGNEY